MPIRKIPIEELLNLTEIVTWKLFNPVFIFLPLIVWTHDAIIEKDVSDHKAELNKAREERKRKGKKKKKK